MEKSTNNLTSILKSTEPENISSFLEEYSSELLPEEKPFSSYMKQILKEKGIRQQTVFLNADISEGYGYKILSEEKHTKQRDLILRLCFAGHFSLEETQRALKIYGMSPLYVRVERDALMILAFDKGIYNISDVNVLLQKNGQRELKGFQAEVE